MFEIVYNLVIKQIEEIGVKFQAHYVDDSCLIFENFEDFKKKWSRIEGAFNKFGFEINYQKTKWMSRSV